MVKTNVIDSAFDVGKFKRKVARGVFISGIKRILYQLILTSSNIILARILNPSVFGSFAIISFLILTLGILSNFGLGTALVQKKETATKQQLQAIFTVLCIASVVFIVLVYFLAPLANILYGGKLNDQSILWLRLFSVSVIISQISTISMRLLERHLEYKKLAIGEIFSVTAIQIITIFFAIKGFGVGSFVLGNLLGGIASFFIFYLLSPWPIGFTFRLSEIKSFLPFGLNFQANSLIGAINGAVVPGFVGIVSGERAVGLVTWAGGIRSAGLAPFDVIEKIIFPAVSRSQDDKKLLKMLIEKMIKISCMFSFPLLALIFALAPSIVSIIYTSVWMEGLTALYLSIIQGVFILLSAVMIDVLLALGRADSVRNISIFWAVLQWILTVPLVLLWGFNGVVLAGVIVSATFFIPLVQVRRYVNIDLWHYVVPYLLYSAFMGFVVFIIGKFLVIDSVWELLSVGSLGAMLYGAILVIFERKEMLQDVTRLREIAMYRKR